jgi:hypothetical protein
MAERARVTRRAGADSRSDGSAAPDDHNLTSGDQLPTPALVLTLALAACGGGKDIEDDGSGDGNSSTTAAAGGSTTSAEGPDPCEGATLEASDVGVTKDAITIAVIADTGSPLRPGLFQGSVDGIEAWADYKNANGGLACREVRVQALDSKLSPTDAKNALTEACGSAFSLVGTTALFLNDMSPAENCKDKSGAATGLPDLAVLQTEAVQQCSDISFAVLPAQGSCPYSGQGERTFQVGTGMWQYYLENVSDDLHGVWVIPRDLPSTISASMPGFRASQEFGIGLDAEFGASALDTQTAYTPFVQAMKDNDSTYGRVGLDYKGTVFLRKEAENQGLDTVEVWDCSLQCYDQRLIDEGGSAVEGQYVWMSFLPFEDEGSNPTLDAFLEYNDKPSAPRRSPRRSCSPRPSTRSWPPTARTGSPGRRCSSRCATRTTSMPAASGHRPTSEERSHRTASC